MGAENFAVEVLAFAPDGLEPHAEQHSKDKLLIAANLLQRNFTAAAPSPKKSGVDG